MRSGGLLGYKPESKSARGGLGGFDFLCRLNNSSVILPEIHNTVRPEGLEWRGPEDDLLGLDCMGRREAAGCYGGIEQENFAF